MHSMEGPIFNDVYNASRDPGSFLYSKLGPVPGFSGGGRVFCYTGECIPGTSLCNPLCLHLTLSNTDAGKHSVGPLWPRDGPGEAFQDTPYKSRTVLQF